MGFPTFQQYQEQYQDYTPNFPRNVNQQYIPNIFDWMRQHSLPHRYHEPKPTSIGKKLLYSNVGFLNNNFLLLEYL
jgi:hypothetical protein